VDACTERGVLLTTTPDGVRRPMAVAAITHVLALSQHLTARDRLSREGRWDDRAGFVGLGLAGRTLGLVGLGNIGREVARLAEPFELVRIAYDPYVSEQQAAAAGTRLTSLEELMGTADFVVVTCALVPETLRLINAERIALMRPDAFLVNVARGPIVDQQALTDALAGGRIAGAGLDVFDPEPLAADDPLTRLDNVILTAHSLGWTDHCFRDCGVSAIRSVIALAEGGRPEHVVNRQALEHARWTS
jgi:D-3-phosphoglycerate dehydrogenase